MKPTQAVKTWEAQIAQIKAKLQAHGAMRPGSLSRQYNVCGKPGCRCKDPKRPRRHGPYYQLNYAYRGKKTSRFIRREILRQVRTELANYKQFRRLTKQWIGLAPMPYRNSGIDLANGVMDRSVAVGVFA